MYLFVYLIWLDPDHRLERVIRSETARDAVSRLHSQEAVQRMAEALFSDRKSGNRAVAVLQINGVEQLPVGEETDRVLYGISAGLSLVLGGSCLMGRQGADQIVIVFPDVTEKPCAAAWRNPSPRCAVCFRPSRFTAGCVLWRAWI